MIVPANFTDDFNFAPCPFANRFGTLSKETFSFALAFEPALDPVPQPDNSTVRTVNNTRDDVQYLRFIAVPPQVVLFFTSEN